MNGPTSKALCWWSFLVKEINSVWDLLMCRPAWTSQRSEGQWCDERHLQTHLEVSREWWRREGQKLLHWEEDSGRQSLDQGGKSEPIRQGVACCHTFCNPKPPLPGEPDVCCSVFGSPWPDRGSGVPVPHPCRESLWVWTLCGDHREDQGQRSHSWVWFILCCRCRQYHHNALH